jgi:hypothetical protein
VPDRPGGARREADRQRQRLARARRKRGEAVYRISVDQAAMVEALIRSGRLTDAATLRVRLVEAALGEVLAEWARRWQP